MFSNHDLHHCRWLKHNPRKCSCPLPAAKIECPLRREYNQLSARGKASGQVRLFRFGNGDHPNVLPAPVRFCASCHLLGDNGSKPIASSTTGQRTHPRARPSPKARPRLFVVAMSGPWAGNRFWTCFLANPMAMPRGRWPQNRANLLTRDGSGLSGGAISKSASSSKSVFQPRSRNSGSPIKELRGQVAGGFEPFTPAGSEHPRGSAFTHRMNYDSTGIPPIQDPIRCRYLRRALQ